MDNNINVPNTNNNYENQYNASNINYNQQPVNDMGYVSNIPNNNNKKSNNVLLIIICIVIIGLFVGGGFFVFKTIFNAAEEVVEETEKDSVIEKEELDTKVHAFSEYQNYKFVMNMSIVASEMEVTTSSNGIADVKNSTDYMETTATASGYSATSYSYSDYEEGYSYSSDDKVTWDRDETTGTESINLSEIIDKINNEDNDVTVLGDNHYSVKIDYESGDVSYNGVYADVYVTNGYISKLYYDLTSVVASEGFSKFTIDIQLSDFNEAGDVIIPDNVKKVGNSI